MKNETKIFNFLKSNLNGQCKIDILDTMGVKRIGKGRNSVNFDLGHKVAKFLPRYNGGHHDYLGNTAIREKINTFHPKSEEVSACENFTIFVTEKFRPLPKLYKGYDTRYYFSLLDKLIRQKGERYERYEPTFWNAVRFLADYAEEKSHIFGFSKPENFMVGEFGLVFLNPFYAINRQYEDVDLYKLRVERNKLNIITL